MSERGPWAHAEDVNDLKATGDEGKVSISLELHARPCVLG